MSEPKFTPGPWVVDINDGEIEICADVQPDGDYISIAIINGDDNFKRAKADADLIIAAPDMYEVLEDFCRGCLGKLETNCTCRVCKIGQALRRARGEAK